MSLFAAARTLAPGARHRLMILAYHRVLPKVLIADDYPYDLELISATAEDFRWQMGFVRDHFQPVSVSQVAASAHGGPRLPPRAVLITFDDGYSDNYEFAFPILQGLGVPACFFVSTAVIGTKTAFWFDYVAQVLMRAPVGSVSLPGASGSLPTATDVPSRRRAIAAVLRRLKNISDQERQEFMTDLERQHYDVADERASLNHPLNWEQVREMARAGFEFGSHGATHAILTRVTPQQLEIELAGSRARLKAETGILVDAIAYPVGGPDAINPQVLQQVKACGYRLGMTYVLGSNSLAGFDPYLLRRQPVERENSRAFFEAQVSWPAYW